jgi:hypothetical protein
MHIHVSTVVAVYAKATEVNVRAALTLRNIIISLKDINSYR